MAKKQKSWQAPSFMASPTERMAWIEEACIGEGESWLKGQTAYQDIPKGLDIVSGKLDASANQQRSSLNINHAKYCLRKIIGTLADVRQVGQFTSDAKFYKSQAEMFNKVAKAVALEAEFPYKLRMALQYMSVTSCGYLWPRWTRKDAGYGEPGAEFLPMGLLDVLPVQMPSDNNLQGCYTVTGVVFMPVWEAHGKFPQFQTELLPIARRKYTSTISARRLDLAERFRYGEPSDNWANLYCEIRYTFINDLSINETGQKIPMGEWKVDSGGNPTEPLTSWSYMVPYLGQEIPYARDAQGNLKTKKAEVEDCRIYPFKRLSITSRGMKQPMYDGPAKDWSGLFPFARYCADDWPWEPSGFSLVHDIYSVERARQTLERGVDQIAQHRVDPGFAYDRSMGMPDTTAETLDIFETRKRVGVDGDPSKVISLLAPDTLLEIKPWVTEMIKYLRDSEDAQLGLNEVSNLAEFKANLTSESLDKALSLVGPLVKDISYGMERSTATVWNILKFMIPQYMTTARVIQYIGPDNVTPETYDFDPESIIPSHGADEIMGYDKSKPVGQQVVLPTDSFYTKVERGRKFAQNLRLLSVPHTMHEITQSQEQLKYLTLYRSGFPISSYDVAKKLNIENYGEINGATMHDRWIAEQEEKLQLQARAATEMRALGLAPPDDQQGTGAGGGQRGTGGRPSSGQQAPKLKAKRDAGGGIRPVTSESG